VGKWFAPNAVLEGTKRPLVPFLLLFNKYNKGQHQIQTLSEISRFAMRPVPHGEELPVPKPQEKLLAMETLNMMIMYCKNVDCYPTFAAMCSSSEPYLFTKEDLNHLVCDLNLSKKQAGLLGSRLKIVESSPSRY
jgi:hypothetical protein